MPKNKSTRSSGVPAVALPHHRIDSSALVNAALDRDPHDKSTNTWEWQAAFLEVLFQQHGNVSAACSAMSITRSAVYRMRDLTPRFAAAWDAVIDATIDEVEQVAFEEALSGDARLIEFILRNRRSDVYGSVGSEENPVRVQIMLPDNGREELPVDGTVEIIEAKVPGNQPDQAERAEHVLDNQAPSSSKPDQVPLNESTDSGSQAEPSDGHDPVDPNKFFKSFGPDGRG